MVEGISKHAHVLYLMSVHQNKLCHAAGQEPTGMVNNDNFRFFQNFLLSEGHDMVGPKQGAGGQWCCYGLAKIEYIQRFFCGGVIYL